MALLTRDDGSFSIRNGLTCQDLEGATLAAFQECCKGLDLNGNDKHLVLQLWDVVLVNKSRARLPPDEKYRLLQEVGFLRASAGWETEKREEVWKVLETARNEGFDAGGLSSNMWTAGKTLADLHHCRARLQEYSSDPQAQAEIHARVKLIVKHITCITDPTGFNVPALTSFAWYLAAAVFALRNMVPAAIKTAKKSLSLLLKAINGRHPTPLLIPNIPNLLRTLLDRPTLFEFATTHVQKGMATMTPASADKMLFYLTQFVDALGITQACCLDADGQPCAVHGLAFPRSELPEAFNLMLLDAAPDWLHNYQKWNWLNPQREARFGHTVTTEESKGTLVKLCNMYSAKLNVLRFLATLDGLTNPELDQSQPNDLQTMLQTLAAKSLHGSNQGRDHINPALAAASKESLSSRKEHLMLRSIASIGEYSLTVDPYLAKLGFDVTMIRMVVRYSQLDKNAVRDLTDRELLPLLGMHIRAGAV